jgi:hypothetical protein
LTLNHSPFHRRRLAATFRDHMLVAALCDWLGIAPAEARVALALYRSGWLAQSQLVHRARSTPRSVRVYICVLRQALGEAAIDSSTLNGLGYRMTPSGRAEIRAIFIAARDALNVELDQPTRLRTVS